jgi:predicted  nucleic acid-binding Zn-ribbon protein
VLSRVSNHLRHSWEEIIEDKISGLRRRLVDLEHGSHQGYSNQGDKAIEALRADLNETNKNLGNLESGGETQMDGTVAQQIELLQQRLKDVEARGGEQGFVLNEHTFSSFAELKDWVKDKNIPLCGAYWDPFSIMVSMSPGQLAGKAHADKAYSSSRTQTTVFENDLLAAMTHKKPECLYGKTTGEMSTQIDVFRACPSYKEWIGIGGADSHKTLLDTRMSSFCSGIRGSLSGPGGTLALALLVSAKDQFTKSTSFIDRFYQELTEVAKFPKGSAWLLVGRCVGAVFHEMASIRSRVSQLEEPQKLHAKSQMIWAMHQCHRVVASFSNVQFWGHTSILKEMNLFMLTERVDPTELVGILQRVRDAEAAAASAKSEFKKLSEKFVALATEVAGVKRQHNDLQNTYKQMQAKVDKIRAKRGASSELPEAPSVKLQRLDGEARRTLRGLTTGFVKVCKDGGIKALRFTRKCVSIVATSVKGIRF